MKVSICMNTARSDYAMPYHPDVHIFEHFMRSLRIQAFKDFEVVISDVYYNYRKNYFEIFKEDFVVQHVPVKPNIWLPFQLTAISTGKNTCLLYAKGEVAIFVDDCASFDESFIDRNLEYIEKGYCTTSVYDVYGDQKKLYSQSDHILQDGIVGGCTNNLGMRMVAWEGLNGYDEMFDGSKCLEDCEIGARIIFSGREIMRLHKPILYEHHDIVSLKSKYPALKCNHLWNLIARKRCKELGIIQANKFPLTDEEFDFMRQCKDNMTGHMCPWSKLNCNFIDCQGKGISGANDEMMKLYKHPSLLFNLREQRKDINKTIENLKQLVEGDWNETT